MQTAEMEHTLLSGDLISSHENCVSSFEKKLALTYRLMLLIVWSPLLQRHETRQRFHLHIVFIEVYSWIAGEKCLSLNVPQLQQIINQISQLFGSL